MRYKVYGQKSYILSRKIFNSCCNTVLFVLVFCWEPLGGILGSPMWTVLTIIVTIVYAGGNLMLSREDMLGLENNTQYKFWIKTAIKLTAAIVALIMLITIGIKASDIYYIPNVSGSDVAEHQNYDELSDLQIQE